MTLPTNLQNFWDEQTAVISGLYERGEISLAQSAQNIFAKSLILIAASFFETEIRDVVIKAINVRTSGDKCVISFCRIKGIDYQFHTWFDWKQDNANKFFSLFGEDFKKDAVAEIKSNANLHKAISDYIFIGSLRNKLVHQNFLTYPLDETAEQTKIRIESAVTFVRQIEKMLNAELDVVALT